MNRTVSLTHTSLVACALFAWSACGDDTSSPDTGGRDAAAESSVEDTSTVDEGVDAADEGTETSVVDEGTDAPPPATEPVSCSFPLSVDAPIGLAFGCDLEIAGCRFFGPSGLDVGMARPRCGDDEDIVDLQFADNVARPMDTPSVRGGAWTIVAASEGTVFMGGFSQVVGLPIDADVTLTVADEGGAEYEILFQFVSEPRSLAVQSITPL
ncbi:MAG: hypothetical protein AAF645_12755 [Myxococcota bacterium]